MSAARHAVLSALRSSTRHVDDTVAARVPAHTRPAFTGDVVQRLVDKLLARSASVERLARLDELPSAVLRYLATQGLPGRLACAGALRAGPWPPTILDLHWGAARRDERLAVSVCLTAVAESGSLMLVSSPLTPTTLNFVPEHHLVVVRADQIVRHLEDGWQRLRRHAAEQDGMPRTVNMISGPSRTADVEQTLQLGAHGPRRLHVMIVGAAA